MSRSNQPTSGPEDVSVETVAGIASKTPLARILAAEAAISLCQSPYLSSQLSSQFSRVILRPLARVVPNRLTFLAGRKILLLDTSYQGFSAAAQPPCHSRGISERFFEIAGLSAAPPGSFSGSPAVHVERLGLESLCSETRGHWSPGFRATSSCATSCRSQSCRLWLLEGFFSGVSFVRSFRPFQPDCPRCAGRLNGTNGCCPILFPRVFSIHVEAEAIAGPRWVWRAGRPSAGRLWWWSGAVARRQRRRGRQLRRSSSSVSSWRRRRWRRPGAYGCRSGRHGGGGHAATGTRAGGHRNR